jgi:hypothetical protein
MKIQLQIVERPGNDLRKALIGAMRTGALQTFFTQSRGKKVRHISPDYPGWMNWGYHDGVITCLVLSPKKPGSEWKLFHAFLGRLADRFANQIHSINIQFVDN